MMEKLSSILAVVDRSESASRVLGRAILLARHFGARVELLLCLRADDPDDGSAFLDALLASVAAEDVPFTAVALPGRTPAEIVLRHVADTAPDLVLKAPEGHHALRRPLRGSNDWQLLKSCPVPLMLTRGRPWKVRPCFAAAVDDPLGDQDQARSVLHAAEYLSLGCQAEVHLLHAARLADVDPEVAACVVAHEFHVPAQRIHVERGEPRSTVVRLARQYAVDLLVLGAQTRRGAVGEYFGTVASQLIDELDCDFVFVGP